MNQPVDTTLMIIIILLLVLILILIVIAALVLVNYLKSTKNSDQNLSQDVKSHDIDDSVTSPGTGVCKNHENKSSVGICAICEEEFCIDCLKQIEKVNLCPEHFNTFADNIWHPITNQKTSPTEPEDGVYIYKFKQHLWKDKGIPTYILNEYKIQVENDHIETYVQLHVKENDKDSLSKEIIDFKGNLKNDK